MSVEEIKSDLPRLSRLELQDLFNTAEDVMDIAAAEEAKHTRWGATQEQLIISKSVL